MIYPLAIGGSCIITSIIGTFFVRLGKSNNIMGALYKGFIATAVLSLILYQLEFLIGLDNNLNNNGKIFSGFDFYICAVAFSNYRINYLDYRVLYRTNFRPVKSVVKSSTTGHGTNVIQGQAISRKQLQYPQ